MPDYRRYRVAGGTYFFTVNVLQRYPNDLLVRPIEPLRTVVKHGFVQRAVDWPYSTFHRYVERGIYSLDGACGPEFEVQGGESG
jgi:hypothetical protein